MTARIAQEATIGAVGYAGPRSGANPPLTPLKSSYGDNPRWTVAHADCRDWLATLDEASVDAIVTDPPYEIGFMGRRWDRTGVAFDPATWAAALRVLKPGGHLLSFGGARTYHRLGCAIEDAGFEVRDQLIWLYGQGFPKTPAVLKPAHEPIALARKPFVGSASANVARYGTGGLNIAACRIATDQSTSRPGTRSSGGILSVVEGGCTRQSETHELGRWPANVIHDGSDEVLASFPDVGLSSGGWGGAPRRTKNGAMYGGLAKSGVGVSAGGFGDSGSAARYFYCAKASHRDREEGLEHLPASASGAGRPRRNTHETVKPTTLMRWLVRLVTPPGGLVVDPFTGSGSTGKATLLEGYRFAGCELTADYLPIIAGRLAHAERTAP